MMFERLNEVREENDLKQKDLANIFKINRTLISKWEHNVNLIPLKYLNMYANYFNVSFDYLSGLSKTKQYKNVNKDLNINLIGSRIKELRKIKNLTVRDLADALNTSPSTISAYETGKVLINTQFAYDIASKYKVSLDWLCGKTK